MNINSFYGVPGNSFAQGAGNRPAIVRDENAVAYTDPTRLNGELPEPGKNSWLDALQNGTAAVFNPKSVEDYNEHLRANAARALEKLGIALEDGEALELSLGADNRIVVGGLKDPAKSEALARELNTARAVSLTGAKGEKTLEKNLYDGTFYLNSDYARQADDFDGMRARADLIRLKNTAGDSVRRMTGVDLDFSALYRDEAGNIGGYPAELAWIFTGNYDTAPEGDADKSRYATAQAINHMAARLLDAGYRDIPAVGDLGVSFRYASDDLKPPPKPLDVEA